MWTGNRAKKENGTEMKIDRNREQELATTVQAARGALLNLLTKHERKTTRRHGSEEPETFEDHAREIADNTSEHASPRSRVISDALNLYQNAINALWTHAQEADTVGYLVATWKQKHKGYAWIDRDTLECEALFKLRHFIGLFKPGNGNLVDYSLRGMHQHLTEYAAKMGPIEVPRDESRGTGPSSYRQSMDLMDEQMPFVATKEDDGVYRQNADEGLASNPFPLIDACIDGDITDDDL